MLYKGDSHMAVGKRIKLLRIKRALTQKELAEKAGIPVVTLQQYEREVRKQPKTEQLEKIAKALGTTPVFLAGQIDVLSSKRSCVFRERLGKILDNADSTDVISAFSSSFEYEKVLSDTKPITFDTAYDIADTLGVSLNYLIGTTDDPDDTSLPEAELLLAIEKESERSRQETLQEKVAIEHEAPDKIKAAQDALLKAVMDICKDPAPLNEAQRLWEQELMPARIIHVRDFLLLKDSLDFLSNNMPGLTCTTRPKRNNAAESELLFYFRNAAPELQKAALAVLKSASSEKISTANEE